MKKKKIYEKHSVTFYVRYNYKQIANKSNKGGDVRDMKIMKCSVISYVDKLKNEVHSFFSLVRKILLVYSFAFSFELNVLPLSLCFFLSFLFGLGVNGAKQYQQIKR